MRFAARLSIATAVGLLLVSARAGATGSLAANPWLLSSAPSPDDPTSEIGDRLFAVSADAPTDAWAVGNNGVSSLALHWDGTHWRVSLNVPTEAPEAGDLLSVAAVSPTDVWAAGEDLAHWNGTGWTRRPLPSANGYVWTGMSASASAGVWAVDYAANLYHLEGSTWKQVYTSRLVGAVGADVVALTPTDVWVSVNTGQPVATRIPRALHWNGTKMSVYELPSRSGATAAAIAGDSAGDVWIVGSHKAAFPIGTKPYAVRWNGAVWASHQPPIHTSPHELDGVAVSSPQDVWAVGGRLGAVSQNLDLLEDQWTGGAWTGEWGGPNPGGIRDNQLEAASAIPGTSQTWAVGSYELANGKAHTLIVHCCG